MRSSAACGRMPHLRRLENLKGKRGRNRRSPLSPATLPPARRCSGGANAMPARKFPIPKRSDIPRIGAGLVLAGLLAAAWRYEGRLNAEKQLAKPESSALLMLQSPAPLSGPTPLPSSWLEWKSIALEIYHAMSEDRLLA